MVRYDSMYNIVWKEVKKTLGPESVSWQGQGTFSGKT